MFFSSILEGIKILGAYQIWVGGLIYATVFIILLFIGGILLSINRGTGCLWMIIQPFILSIVLTIVIITVFPLLIGGKEITKLTLIIEEFTDIIKIALVSGGFVLILSFIPFIGGFISNSPGGVVFLKGVIIFRMFSRIFLDQQLLDYGVDLSKVYPSIFHTIGYFIIAGILNYIILLILSIVKTKIKTLSLNNPFYDDDIDIVDMFIMPVTTIIAGLATICMYSSYVFISLTNIFNS